MNYRRRITLVFWTAVVLGFGLPAGVAIVADSRNGSVVMAASHWAGNLFEPGYNEFALSALHAAPYVLAAVFALFHLAHGWKQGELRFRSRLAGIFGAILAGAVFSTATLWAIRTSRSSTAAIGYLFLPFEVVPAILIGYALGRLAALRLYRDTRRMA